VHPCGALFFLDFSYKYLDNIGMNFLGDLFNSKARTEVLRALCVLPKPMGIRPLARLTRLHPRSVERTLEALREEGMVIRHPHAGHKAAVAINRQHPAYGRLRELFHADTLAELSTRTSALAGRGVSLCSFMDDGLALIQRGRRSLHDAE